MFVNGNVTETTSGEEMQFYHLVQVKSVFTIQHRSCSSSDKPSSCLADLVLKKLPHFFIEIYFSKPNHSIFVLQCKSVLYKANVANQLQKITSLA